MTATITETIGAGSRNLLLDTEDIAGGAAWSVGSPTGTRVLSTTVKSDDGYASTLLDDTDTTGGNGAYSVVQSISGLTDTSDYTFTAKLKRDDSGASQIRLWHPAGTKIMNARYDWTTGVFTENSAGSAVGSAAVQERGTGWIRLRATIEFDSADGNGTLRCEFNPAFPDHADVGGVWASEPQLELGTVPTAYQYVGATDHRAGAHVDIAAWESATDQLDLVADDEIRAGELVDDTYEVDANVLVMAVTGGGTRSATQYRHLKAAPNRYLPHTHKGPKVYVKWLAGGTGDEAGLKIEEDFFRLSGIGFICEDPGETAGALSVVKSAIHVEGDTARISGVYVRISEGGLLDGGSPGTRGPTFRCFNAEGASSGAKATDARFYNCIAQGSRYWHGASSGFYFHNFTTDGGVYGCAAYQITRHLGTGFTAATALAAEFPEVANCIAIDAGQVGLGTSGCFKGGWSRFANNLSSDTSAAANLGGSTGVNSFGIVATPDLHTDPANAGQTSAPRASGPSYGGQSATSIWTAPLAQDFRLRQAAVALQGGNYEGQTFASPDGPGIEDYLGTSRGTGQEPWNIGPIDEVKNAATSSAPSTVTEYIGPGRWHATVQAWLDETEGRHLLDLNRVYVGQLEFNGATYNQGSTTLQILRTIGDAKHYRELRSVDEHRANPTTSAGTIIVGTGATGTATVPVVDVTEHHFRLTGIKLRQDYTGTESRRLLRVIGDEVRLDALWLLWDGGTGTDNVIAELTGSRCLVTNCLAVGAGDAATGGTVGFQVKENFRTKLYNCVADQIDGNAAGDGFEEGLRASLSEFANCIATSSNAGFSHQAGNAPKVQSHCIADDTSADGDGAQVSVAASTIWVGPTTGDYRLLAGSPAEKAGANLSFRFDTDFHGKLRRAPFDIGIFEGIGFDDVLSASTPDQASYLCTLWEIARVDGVSHYFTDASGPIPHAGRTYQPAGGFNASNRRAESGAGESSVSAIGAVSSDDITEADLKAGRFRSAVVKERLVDWREPFRAPVVEREYTLADTRWDGQIWRAEMLGIASALDREEGDNITISCPYTLGDESCGKDISADIQDDVRVSSTIADARRKFDAESADISGSYADDFFGKGELIWLTGSNAGLVSIVKNYTTATRTVELEQRLPFDLVAADKFILRPGCRKRYLLDCITKFSNGLRFGGEPFHPGTDKSLRTPQR